MYLSADALKLLFEAGLSGEQIVEVARAFEASTKEGDRAKWGKKAGAARHGYTGPIEPRPSEEEWWAIRAAIIRRDEGVCAYCDDYEGQTLTADHIIPLSRGGSNEPWNLICCCLPCNNSKRDHLVTEWRGRSTTRKLRIFDHLKGHMTEASGGDPGVIRQ